MAGAVSPSPPPSPPPLSRPARDCLTLNENEQRIFQLLEECCRDCQLPVTLRVAGGWVRDKLLGLECHDFDIAIDRMMGQQFAAHLRSYLLSRAIPASAYGVIQANPERSKHLETATLTIFGYPIDFVNLRSESYTGDSRIPATITFGTPREDALRRDITINALFYNIHSRVVEDFCGTGFADLQQRLIRTPLPPKETLLDDPLRLLRVVRFATRFGFTIEPSLQAAMMDENVDAAFRFKISRERVGVELDKILRDRRALDGLNMLHRLNVFNLVFDVPAELYQSHGRHLPAHETIHALLTLLGHIQATWQLLMDGYNRRLALLAAVLLPFRDVLVERGGSRKAEPLVLAILRDSLKFTTHDMTDVQTLLAPLDRVIALASATSPSDERAQLGRLVRALGRHWEIAFQLAAIAAALADPAPDVVARYQAAAARVNELGLSSAWSWRPLLSGHDIQQLTGIREGRAVGRLLDALMQWQFEHPDGDRQKASDLVLALCKSQSAE